MTCWLPWRSPPGLPGRGVSSRWHREVPVGELTESLRRDVENLATPAGRMVGSAGHEAARTYLLERLRQLGLPAYRGDLFDLPYRVGTQAFHNLVALIPGSRRELRPILIGAHYDSVIAACCADDNAAAIAIALSAVEPLSAAALSHDVVVALFDAEEPPHFHSRGMGSTRFYEDQRLPIGFDSAIIMDLVGHDVSLGDLPIPRERAADLLFVTGAESHPSMAAVLRSAAGEAAIPIVATLNRYVGDMSDHHAFRLNNVPFFFLSCGHWEHYHQPTDTPDRLNYAKIGRIRDLLVDLVRRLDRRDGNVPVPAGYDVDPTACPDEIDDHTVGLEIELLNKALGPALSAMLGQFALRLQTRADLDRLVAMFIELFDL